MSDGPRGFLAYPGIWAANWQVHVANFTGGPA